MAGFDVRKPEFRPMTISTPPSVFWADGAGSRVVFDSLQGVLNELRGAVLSDRAIALYQPTTIDRGYYVLSDSCHAGLEPALGNELLLLERPLDLYTPSRVTGVTAKSALRPFRLRFASALAIPWDDAFGRGVVLIGVQDGGMPEQSLDRLELITDARRLASMLSESRMSGTLSLQRQVSAALRNVLAADVSGAGPLGRLSSLVGTARALFGSDTAYLALPEETSGTSYYFGAFSNVNTPQFRQLRMEFGQGLGGLARRQGRVVSSMNYAQDERLLAAPVSETVDEGILSAIAAPLLRADDILGVLYVGSRSPHPYSETDERILAEFADYISLLMDLPEFEAVNQHARLNRMREDFAHAIHDSVVRSLVQIGFTAEQASVSVGHDAASTSIATIQKAAENALSSLREELHVLVPPNAAAISLSQVLERITSVPARSGVSRTVLVLGQMAEAALPASVAELLIHVGAEALTNSMKHSECRNESIELRTSPTRVILTISDDGRGSPIIGMGPAQLSSMGHLGLASMHRRADRMAAKLEVTSRVDNGTTICVKIPRTW